MSSKGYAELARPTVDDDLSELARIQAEISKLDAKIDQVNRLKDISDDMFQMEMDHLGKLLIIQYSALERVAAR